MAFAQHSLYRKCYAEGFTDLVGSAGERAEDDGENVRTFLSKACMQLAFLTDFCRNWPPAKDWLGTINNWSPLAKHSIYGVF